MAPANIYQYNVDLSTVEATSSSSLTNLYYVTSEYYRNFKKEETRQQRLIRQASAFKSFYKKSSYTPKSSRQTAAANFTEAIRRPDRYKGLSENLIL